MLRFQLDAIPKHDCLVECDARLGAVPTYEIVDRDTIRSLRLRRTQGIQNGQLRMVQVRKPQHTLRSTLRLCFRSFHRVRAPLPAPDERLLTAGAYNWGMSMFMCRWPNGDLSFVHAPSKEEAIIALDEWDNAELAEITRVSDFM